MGDVSDVRWPRRFVELAGLCLELPWGSASDLLIHVPKCFESVFFSFTDLRNVHARLVHTLHNQLQSSAFTRCAMAFMGMRLIISLVFATSSFWRRIITFTCFWFLSSVGATRLCCTRLLGAVV